MSVCVRPPPMFPQPPAVAFAVPTTDALNKIEFQNWFTTKVEPRADTKNRAMTKPVLVVTAALQATTIAPQSRRMQSVFTGPSRSMTPPRMKRVKTSNETEAMLASPMIFLQLFLQMHFTTFSSMSSWIAALLSQIPMSLRTTVSRGAKANQPMNASMNAMVAPQNPRMCGFVCLLFPQKGTGITPATILKGLNSRLLFLSSTATSNTTVVANSVGFTAMARA
mmetsp:Transcript_61651/g.161964  ORF Transcript_61651/g.161964 Transcript_61651/m.161964 type:complete len:223 (+) Transcript_61651:441-1109(+)